MKEYSMLYPRDTHSRRVVSLDGMWKFQIVQGGRFTMIAGVFSVLAIIYYILCYKLTTERVRVEVKAKAERAGFFKTVGSLFKNRALLASIVLAGQTFFNMVIWANSTDVIDYQEKQKKDSTENLSR